LYGSNKHKEFYSFLYSTVKEAVEKLTTESNEEELAQLSNHLIQQYQDIRGYNERKYAYILLSPNQDIKYGVVPNDPMANVDPKEVNHEHSQFLVATVSDVHALYNFCKANNQKKHIHLLAKIDLQQVVGAIQQIPKRDADESTKNYNTDLLIEGYIPACAILKVYNFSKATPLISRLLSIKGQRRNDEGFTTYIDWLDSFNYHFTSNEVVQLYQQAEHFHLFLTSPNA